MDSSETRRELVRSVLLPVRDERWLVAGLLGGAAGYVVWLAGTGAVVPRATRSVIRPETADSWSTDVAVLTLVFAVLWVLVPSVVAVRFVVGRLTNLRGNIERAYRVDRPLVLLVPPAALLAVVVAVALLSGTVSATVLWVGGTLNAFLLVRTVAYGYRVYSFSTPRLLQALLFVAAVVACLAAVSRAGSLTGRSALVRTVAARYGVEALAFGEVTGLGVTAPTLPLAGALAPGVLAVAYVAVQLAASLVVRARRPDVARSAVRAGQRYPAVVQPGTSSRLALGAGGTGDATGEESDADAPGPQAPDGPAGEQAVAADDETGSRPAATDGSTGAAASSPASEGPEDAATTADSPGDRFGQTRVYTPPEDDESGDGDGAVPEERSGDADLGGNADTGAGGPANVVGGAAEADTRAASEAADGATGGDARPESETPGGNAVDTATEKTEVCPICGATFGADPERVHCPNCNAVLDTSIHEE